MPNFDRRLRQSIWYVPARFDSGRAQIAIPEEPHPLATISPQFWLWPAEDVLKIFRLFGVIEKEDE